MQLGLAEPWPDGCFKHADHQQQAHRILPLTSPQTNSNQSNQTIKPWSRMARSQINAADPQTINPIKASRHQWPCVHGSGHSAPSICNPLHPAGNTSSQDEDNASIVSHWSRHKSCSESRLRPSSTVLSHHKTEPSSPHAPASTAMANIIHSSHTTQPGLSLSLISCLA